MASPSTASPSTSFTEDGTIQTFLVQTSGEYEITAVGADGGDSDPSSGLVATGGAGAEVQGDFALTAGDTVEILVGGAGLNDYYPPGTLGGGAGGGGGAFVVLEGATPADNVLLEAAGGGGGASAYYGASNGVDGQAGTSGTAGLAYSPSPNLGAFGYGGAGGSNSSGGDSGIGTNGGDAPSDYITGGGGGAGYSGDGGVINDFTNASGMVAELTPAQSFLNGGGGGTYPGDGTGGVDNGGYGGGGATDAFEGGGGGGYSGGGGGSYVNAALATNIVLTGGENTGADEVEDGNGTASITRMPCFCRGTRIAVPGGETAVEDLRVGDTVLTASGGLRPIVWIGHRALTPTKHPRPNEVYPIRVEADAFGTGLPHRDLWLSPKHCLAAEGALIPAMFLLNGVSVAQVRTSAVEYWHIELDAHDVILAEGLPAESYLDCGNRSAFANGGVFIEAHPDFSPKDLSEMCLPLAKRGPAVVATKSRLIARIAERGLRIDHEADAHIVVDGRRIEPTLRTDKQLAFALPSGGREITLRSKTYIPAHTIAKSADFRELGISVRRLRVDNCEVALDGEKVDESGWNEAEFRDGQFTHRWTSGATRLPAGAESVIFDLFGVGAYWSGTDESALKLSA